MKESNNKTNTINKNNKTISLNNAKKVLDMLTSEEASEYDSFLTMLHGNSFNGVNITEENIRNNSRFIVDLWD